MGQRKDMSLQAELLCTEMAEHEEASENKWRLKYQQLESTLENARLRFQQRELHAATDAGFAFHERERNEQYRAHLLTELGAMRSAMSQLQRKHKEACRSLVDLEGDLA